MREVADTVKVFEAIEGQIYRYPALDARAFRLAVENAIASLTS